MKNFKCKRKGDAFHIEGLILDACHRNPQRYPLFTPEYTVTFTKIGKDSHKVVVVNEDMKTVATAVVDKFDM